MREAIDAAEERVPEGQPEVPEAQDEVQEVRDRVHEVLEEVRLDRGEVQAVQLIPVAQLVEEAVSEHGGDTTARHQRRGDRLQLEEPEPWALQKEPRKTTKPVRTSHESLPVAPSPIRSKARKHEAAVVSKSEGSHQCGSREPSSSHTATTTWETGQLKPSESKTLCSQKTTVPGSKTNSNYPPERPAALQQRELSARQQAA